MKITSRLPEGAKVYIAGPMTGYPDLNYPSFYDAEQVLTELGYVPVNPARNLGGEGGKHPKHVCLREDLTTLLGQADAVAFLRGWRRSEGAVLEHHVATKTGLLAFELDSLDEVEPYDDRVRAATIVGLSGWARSGKDSLARHLVEGYGFERLSFLDGARELAAAIDPPMAKKVASVGWEVAELDRHIRVRLEHVSESVRAVIGDDAWVRRVLGKIREDGRYVVTDVRLPEEMRALVALDALMVWVYRAGNPPDGDQPTERSLDGRAFDVVIHNAGTLSELRGGADEIAVRLGLAAKPTSEGEEDFLGF